MPILNLQAAWSQPSVNDEGAWRTGGAGASYATMAGNTITDSVAITLSGVSACYSLITESIAQLNLILYDRITGADGKDAKRRATDQLAFRLHDAPNDDQTQFEFVEQMTGIALFHPFAYAEKVYSGPDVQVIPRTPDRLRSELIRGTGKRRFSYLEDDGTTWRPIPAEDMFRLPGKDILSRARESFGIARAVQTFGARNWANGVRPSGFISRDPGVKYTEAGLALIHDTIAKDHAGAFNAGGILSMPDGSKWNQLGMTNEQAEFVAYSSWTVVDCARHFGVPPYRVGITDPGAMSNASVEAQGIELIIFTFMPHVKRWEQAIGRDLIGNRDQFAEFLLAGLARGTLAERYAAYAVGRQWGWLSVNDILRMENKDGIGPQGDVYMTPLNMQPGSGPTGVVPGSAIEAGSPADTLASLFIGDAADRVVRKEQAAMAKAAELVTSNPAVFEAAVRGFYASHATYVHQQLHIPASLATAYAEHQRDAMLSDGPSAMAAWDTADLVSLVMGASR